MNTKPCYFPLSCFTIRLNGLKLFFRKLLFQFCLVLTICTSFIVVGFTLQAKYYLKLALVFSLLENLN